MVLSKRERYIGLLTGGVVIVFIIFQFMVSPLIARRQELDKGIVDANDRLKRDDGVIENGKRAKENWTKLAGNALRSDSSGAESQVYNNVREWAADSNMSLASLKPERAAEKEKDFYKVTFRATGTGSMTQVSHFLWRIQNSMMAIRITDLQLSSRKEGSDDLSLSVVLATIYPVPESEKSNRGNSVASIGREVTP